MLHESQSEYVNSSFFSVPSTRYCPERLPRMVNGIFTIRPHHRTVDGGWCRRNCLSILIEANDPTDKISAVYGNDQEPLVFSTPSGIFNSAFNASWNASGINPAFLPIVPDLVDDSYATIGLTGPASVSGIPGAADPSLVEDFELPTTVSGYFQNGGTELNVNTLTGASWYVLNTAGNALPDADQRWLVYRSPQQEQFLDQSMPKFFLWAKVKIRATVMGFRGW